MNNRRNELAPCGVFCAACPSFDKTCNGCSSDNQKQKNGRFHWIDESNGEVRNVF